MTLCTFFLLVGCKEKAEKLLANTNVEEQTERVLFIVSNAHYYGDSDISASNHFSEIVHAYDVFAKAGYEIDFVSPKGGAIPIGYISSSDSIQKKYLYDNDFMDDLERTQKPEDLNARNTLFGGTLLQWIDEEAGIYAMTKLDSRSVVTKYMSEINFMSTALEGDIIEIGIDVVKFGVTSISLNCEVRNKMTHESIVTVDNIIMVNLDEHGNPKAHGKTKIEYVKDRLAKKEKEEEKSAS